MDPDKKARANNLFRTVQMAHVRGLIKLHHMPSLELTLENYLGSFKAHAASPKAARMPERVRRFMQKEVSVITDALAACYDVDKQKMLSNLEVRPGLLDRMPLVTDI